MVNPNKTTGYRLLGPVNMRALQDKVEGLSEKEWAKANSIKPNKFDALGSTQHVVLRFPKNLTSHKESYDTDLWPEWKELIEPLIQEATEFYSYDNGYAPRIMIARLPAKGLVKKHIDKSPSAQFPHKIHIPLKTNTKAFFYANGTPVQMESGFAYEVNNNQLHWAKNDGDSDRIHLIFEYYPIEL